MVIIIDQEITAEIQIMNISEVHSIFDNMKGVIIQQGKARIFVEHETIKKIRDALFKF